MTRRETEKEKWMVKKARTFPKLVKVSLDLETGEVQKFFGRGTQFTRAPFKTAGYCLFGFRDEWTLNTFCKRFAKHLVSDDDEAA